LSYVPHKWCVVSSVQFGSAAIVLARRSRELH
jgi:hypothetical protein